MAHLLTITPRLPLIFNLLILLFLFEFKPESFPWLSGVKRKHLQFRLKSFVLALLVYDLRQVL